MLKKVSTKSAKKVITLLGKYFSKKLITVGSICRGEKYHSDIDIIVLDSLAKLKLIKNKLIKNKLIKNKLLKKSNKKLKLIQVYLKGNRHQGWLILYKNVKYKIDLFLAKKKELPYMLFHYIGPKSYNIRTRAYAKRKGWLLNQYGLWYSNNSNKRVKNFTTEKKLVQFLGLTYRKPNNRK